MYTRLYARLLFQINHLLFYRARAVRRESARGAFLNSRHPRALSFVQCAPRCPVSFADTQRHPRQKIREGSADDGRGNDSASPQAAELTLLQVALRSGVSKAIIHRLEHHNEAKFQAVVQVARVLALDPGSLFAAVPPPYEDE